VTLSWSPTGSSVPASHKPTFRSGNRIPRLSAVLEGQPLPYGGPPCTGHQARRDRGRDRVREAGAAAFGVCGRPGWAGRPRAARSAYEVVPELPCAP
jgi:hypothetical protein